MARYIGRIKGQRGEASRLGNGVSGIRGHIRGWNIGGSVNCSPRDDDGSLDAVVLTLTGGTNGKANLGVQIIATEEYSDHPRFVVYLPGDVMVEGRVGSSELTVTKHDESFPNGARQLLKLT